MSIKNFLRTSSVQYGSKTCSDGSDLSIALTPDPFEHVYMRIRATSQAPKRQARRGTQLVLKNLLTFLLHNLSRDLFKNIFISKQLGYKRIEGVCKRLGEAGL